MDKSRVAGIDITVEKASEENGYVELTPEAEQNSWAMIGKALGLFLISVALFMLCLSPAAGRNLNKQGKLVSVTLQSIALCDDGHFNLCCVVLSTFLTIPGNFLWSCVVGKF